MASEKKPSIYQDRGTIGSARELDEYGVWVKSEPQDLVDDEKDRAGGDFFLDGLGDLPDFDASSGQDSVPLDSDFSIPEDDFNLDGGDESAAFSFDAESAGEGGDFSLGDDDLAAGLSLGDDDLDLSLPEDFAEEALVKEALPEGDLPEKAPPEEAASKDEASSKDEDAENPAPGTNDETDDEGFDEISLEELLGDMMDELPGEDLQEKAGEGGGDLSKNSADKSTRLLMKIAEELSSIRAELSALKQEFSAARGTEGGEGESHGFFNDAGADDKIALTGDELNNILKTAEFTEESGINAVEEELSPGFSEGDTSAAPVDVSPEAESSPTELNLDDLSLDDLNITEEPEAEEPELSSAGLNLDDLSLDDLNIAEEPEAEEPELSSVELNLDDLSLDDLNIAEEPEAEELELSGAGQPDELAAENPDDSEISLVDLSDDDLNMGLPVETGPAALDTAGEDTEGGETGEFSLGDGEIILEEEPLEGAEDSNSDNEPDISLDLSFSGEDSGEEISLGDFEEEALDLSNAVIDEPDLGVDLKENPVQEPVFDDFASLDGSLDKNDGELSLESSGEAPAEALEEQDFPPLGEPGEIEEISGEAEISGGEGEDISPAGGNISRGEDLDQIIPDGFVVEELDDEGADFGGLEEGLDEIPEAVELPEEEAGALRAGIEAPDEPELSTLPGNFKSELKQVLSYMDQLLESLPEEKIEEFAKSEYFDTYKKLFKELGLA